MSKLIKRHHIVYKTTHLPSAKYYIGRHCTARLDDGYLGSGRALKELLRIDPNKDNYHTEVIKNCTTSKEMLDEEVLIVSKQITDPLCLNKRKTRDSGIIQHSTTARQKMSESHADVNGNKNPRYGVKVSKNTKEKISRALTGRKLSTIHELNCHCAFCPTRGVVSERTKKKMSISAKNSINAGKFKKGNIPWNKK